MEPETEFEAPLLTQVQRDAGKLEYLQRFCQGVDYHTAQKKQIDVRFHYRNEVYLLSIPAEVIADHARRLKAAAAREVAEAARQLAAQAEEALE